MKELLITIIYWLFSNIFIYCMYYVDFYIGVYQAFVQGFSISIVHLKDKAYVQPYILGSLKKHFYILSKWVLIETYNS